MAPTALVEGGIPAIAGILATWLGYRSVSQSRYFDVSMTRRFRWMGPALILFGLFVALTAAGEDLSSNEMADRVVAQTHLPVKIDQITTLTAVDGKGNELHYHLAIDVAVVALGGPEKAKAALLKQICAMPATKILDAKYSLHFTYDLKNSDRIDIFPSIAVCDKIE